MMDDEPCRIVAFSTSKPDKVGKFNVSIKAVGLFDTQRHHCISPSRIKIEVPKIERGSAGVLAIVANNAQLMDRTTHEIFQLPISMELRGVVREHGEIEYIQAQGRRKIELVKN